MLIATRAVQGVGAALMIPTTLSIITAVFPAHERPKAIGVWPAAVGIFGFDAPGRRGSAAAAPNLR